MELKIVMDMKSLDKVMANCLKTLTMGSKAAARGLKELGTHIIKIDSFAQVPKVTGTLAESGFVGDPQITSNSVTVRIGYGGPNDRVNPFTGKPASSYMVPVHERLGVNHPDGKAKFLEDPVNQATKRYEDIVGGNIRAVLNVKGGVK